MTLKFVLLCLQVLIWKEALSVPVALQPGNCAANGVVANNAIANNVAPTFTATNVQFTPIIPDLQLGDLSLTGDLPIGGTIKVCGCFPVYGMIAVDGSLPSAGTAVISNNCGLNNAVFEVESATMPVRY